jgi:nucleotide-binding universal stress UspA family protein
MPENTGTDAQPRPRDVLVPFDNSPRSEVALHYACGSFPDDRVVALFVLERTDENEPPGWVGAPEQFEAWVEERRDQADREVFAAARRIADEHDRTLSTALALGNSRRAIVDYWNANDFDFLVVGVHGRGFPRVLRYLTGDTGERFARTSIPTVLVNDEMDLPTERAESERRVLVPFDQSARSRNALAFACSTFPDADVTVLCMYVIWGTARTVLLDRYTAREERMSELVSTVERIAAEYETSVDTVYGYGSLDQAVLQFLDERPTDLVVAGTRGRATFSDLTVPSAAERLVRHCPVPLAVVPLPPGEDSQRAPSQSDQQLPDG